MYSNTLKTFEEHPLEQYKLQEKNKNFDTNWKEEVLYL